VSESIAERLSTIGLVAGFPLLLLCFMLSLEKLESWGLREVERSPEEAQLDKVEAAMDAIEQLAKAQHLASTTIPPSNGAHPVEPTRPVAAYQAGRIGRPTGEL
jgi:hypothetical protein